MTDDATTSDWAVQVPSLKDWKTLPEIARILGVSRQRVHAMAREGKFATLHRLADSGSSKVILLVTTAEVDKVVAARAKAEPGGS